MKNISQKSTNKFSQTLHTSILLWVSQNLTNSITKTFASNIITVHKKIQFDRSLSQFPQSEDKEKLQNIANKSHCVVSINIQLIIMIIHKIYYI